MTSYRSVEFVPGWTARAREGRDDTIVISINNSFDPVNELKPGWRDVLVLQFDDVSSLSHNLIRFSRSHAEQVIAFLRRHEQDTAHVLVHCVAGEKRSAAVAKVVAKLYSLEFPADYDKHHEWVYHVFARVLRFEDAFA